MELFLTWAFVGALVGFVAAQRKGLNVVGAVIGGALLGPLSFFMLSSGFTGISSSNEARRKCPFCAEWVQREAIVCPHCRRDLEQRNAQAPGAPPVAERQPQPPAVPPRPLPPTPGRGAALAAGLLAGAVVGGGVVALVATSGSRDATPLTEVIKLDDEERAGYEETIAVLRAGLDEEVARRVAAENASADAAAEAQQPQPAPRRVVTERPRPPAPEPEPEPAGRIAIVDGPTVEVHNRELRVSGELQSTVGTPARALLTVNAYEDGRLWARKTFDIDIPASGGRTFSVTLSTSASPYRRYSVVADVSPR